MADAICEAKSEPLTVAYVKDEDEKEVTMNDAVSSVVTSTKKRIETNSRIISRLEIINML